MLTGKGRKCIEQTVLYQTDEKQTHINVSLQTRWQRLCVRPYLKLHRRRDQERGCYFTSAEVSWRFLPGHSNAKFYPV